jgi:signal transduction histidine kinase
MKSQLPATNHGASVHPRDIAGGDVLHRLSGLRRPNLDLTDAAFPPPEELVRLATLGAISAGVAHDLGNLLQVIASGLHLIDRNLRQSTGADLKPFCDGALAAIDRAAMLRLQILDQARARDTSASRIDFSASVAGIRSLIELTAGPGVHVETPDASDTVWVHCDAQGLENVILNLVVNARDAMPQGGRLTIETNVCGCWNDKGIVLAGQAIAMLRVIDTGCGMSPDTLADASKPFFTTKSFGRGTGLGLALVCDFARRWGGWAEIDSSVGAKADGNRHRWPIIIATPSRS